MRGVERITVDSNIATFDLADDPLKGLLRDKAVLDIEKHIRIIQRKMFCVQEAMEKLVESQRASAKAAGSDCMDLYLNTNKASDAPSDKMASELELADAKAGCVVEWRAKRSFAMRYELSPSCRLHPFDAEHKSHQLIFDYVNSTTPNYYKVLAAYETARLTLNHALKSLRKIALDMNKLKQESMGLPLGIFDKETAQLSRRIVRGLDDSEELTWILQGLYFEV